MAQKQKERPPRLPITAWLGENVYRRRTLRFPRMSQEALAEASGLGVNTIQSIEKGRDPARKVNWPQLDTLEKLATGLGCDVADLLEEPSDTRVWSNPDLLVSAA